MKRRRTKDFVKHLETLIKEARKIGLTLKLKCIFHFGQSLFRKFVSLGLRTYYIEKKDVQGFKLSNLLWLFSVPKKDTRAFERTNLLLSYSLQFLLDEISHQTSLSASC